MHFLQKILYMYYNLKFVSKYPIDTVRIGSATKPLPKPMMTHFTDTYMYHKGFNEFCKYVYPDSKVHMAHMEPTWVLSAPGRPHVGPMNLAIRVYKNLITQPQF